MRETYKKPVCDKCSHELLIMEDTRNLAKQKICELGYEGRRTYQYRSRERWLFCEKCGIEWEFEKDSRYRIVKGEKIQ